MRGTGYKSRPSFNKVGGNAVIKGKMLANKYAFTVLVSQERAGFTDNPDVA
jgi:hypothetical protein